MQTKHRLTLIALLLVTLLALAARDHDDGARGSRAAGPGTGREIHVEPQAIGRTEPALCEIRNTRKTARR